MFEVLSTWALERGFKIAAGNAMRLLSLTDRRLAALATGDDFYTAFRARCQHLQARVSDRSSVLMVVMPAVAHRVTLPLAEHSICLLLPPNYVGFSTLLPSVRMELYDLLGTNSVEILRAPYKLLAAQLGLLQYGRNHLLYEPDFGSYVLLGGYLVDRPLEWTEPLLQLPGSKACEDCGRCVAACPTGALTAERGVLRAERCLAFPGRREADKVVLPSDHQCWLGCLSCQTVCQMNRGKLRCQPLDVSFSLTELHYLMYEQSETEGPAASLAQKLESLGLGAYAEEMGRNLRHLTERQGGAARDSECMDNRR